MDDPAYPTITIEQAKELLERCEREKFKRDAQEAIERARRDSTKLARKLLPIYEHLNWVHRNAPATVDSIAGCIRTGLRELERQLDEAEKPSRCGCETGGIRVGFDCNIDVVVSFIYDTRYHISETEEEGYIL